MVAILKNWLKVLNTSFSFYLKHQILLSKTTIVTTQRIKSWKGKKVILKKQCTNVKKKSTSGSKWQPFFKNIITRQKLIFFGGFISRSIYLTNMHISTYFHDFSQKCTIFSHNCLTMGSLGESIQSQVCLVKHLVYYLGF